MKSVLILDDDSDLCSVMKELFLALGASKCLSVTSFVDLQGKADEALRCDIALLDVHLGASRPSGIDAYEWLISAGFAGKVVFFTGHARSHPLLQKTLQYEGVRIIEKPAPIGVLQELLQ